MPKRAKRKIINRIAYGAKWGKYVYCLDIRAKKYRMDVSTTRGQKESIDAFPFKIAKCFESMITTGTQKLIIALVDRGTIKNKYVNEKT